MKKFVCSFCHATVYEEGGVFTAFSKGGKRLYHGKNETRTVDTAKDYSDGMCRAEFEEQGEIFANY